MAEERIIQGPRQTTETYRTETMWIPTSGFTWGPGTTFAPPESIVSGQNVWVLDDILQPRYKVSNSSFSGKVVANASNVTNQGLSSLTSVVLGAFLYNDAVGYGYPVVGTNKNFFIGMAAGDAGTSSKFSFSQLSYVSSTGSSISPSIGALGANDNWFGTNVFSASRGSSLGVWVGDDLTYTYSQPGLVYSLLTGAPGAKDAVTYDNRAILWNTRTIADPIGVPIRVQWHVAGEPEDWTGIGSGFEDLVDAVGAGTRAFVQNDTAYFATEREIWRGRKVGPPYWFQFTPVTRSVGVPFPRAGLSTPAGFVWLGADYMVRLMVGETIQEIGVGFQDLLQQTIATPQTAFFTFNLDLNQLRLFYSTARADALSSVGLNQFPQASITLDMRTGRWFRDVYSHWFHRGYSDDANLSNLSEVGGVGGYKLNTTELLFTSAATGGQFGEFSGEDMNSSTVTEEAVFGPLHTSDPRHLKTLREVRIDHGYVGSPAFQLSVSANGGSSYSETKTIVPTSNVSIPQQSLATFDTTARYHTLRVTHFPGNQGRWRIARLFTEAESRSRER